MTELSFTKEKNKFVSEFVANGAFGLEVRGVKGYVGVMMNLSGEGEYCPVKDSYETGNNIYVKQFGGEVWPVNVKVVCDTEPTYGGYMVSE